MCGIVGYWGPDNPKKVIIDGLQRLEYRGYDSTGVAIMDKGALKVARSSGKLSNLQEKIKDVTFDGMIGIGHTRWATHGEPSERNAHPHKVGSIAIIHNGIIENYREIKEKLLARGADVKSETDSELVAHLLHEELLLGKKVLDAVLAVIPQLQGAYSILVLNEKEPDSLLAFKNGTPMIVGLGAKEIIIASDVQAFIDRTNKVIYLEDGEIALTSKQEIKFFDPKGKSVDKKTIEVNWTAEVAEKAGFDHFMLKEIFEQPRALIQTMEPHLEHNPLRINLKNTSFTDEEFKKFKRIQLVACGTAWHAAYIGKYLLEKIAKIPADVEIASEFRYREPVLSPETLVVTVSQSGETADTLACLRHCKRNNLKVLSICNVAHSTIDREATGRIYTKAGPEIGVCSTKAFTSQIVALQLLTFHLARLREAITDEKMTEYLSALVAIPSQVEICLNHDKWFKEAAHELVKYKGFLYLGRGINFPSALEGALKLKEITYVHAEGYASGELKHGPIALVDESMLIIAIAPKDDLYEKNLSNIEEVRARGGKVISIGSPEDKNLEALSRYYLSVPETVWAMYPLLVAIPVQLLSYHLAVELDRDVDQPRNLAKSVTVE